MDLLTIGQIVLNYSEAFNSIYNHTIMKISEQIFLFCKKFLFLLVELWYIVSVSFLYCSEEMFLSWPFNNTDYIQILENFFHFY